MILLWATASAKQILANWNHFMFNSSQSQWTNDIFWSWLCDWSIVRISFIIQIKTKSPSNKISFRNNRCFQKSLRLLRKSVLTVSRPISFQSVFLIQKQPHRMLYTLFLKYYSFLTSKEKEKLVEIWFSDLLLLMQ